MLKDQALPEEQPVASLGSHFRNARTTQGKSLDEAARITCINPTILTNLEADDFTRMPAEVFTRGFIKLYAQYLGLDVNETLKLYVHQENLDPERPVDQPYRRDILTGATMAHPLSFLRSNPRAMIVAILLAVLLAFYALGAIIKMGQKPADQAAPENDLAKSLVDGTPQPLPGPPGEPPTGTEGTGQNETSETAALTAPQPETPPGDGSAPGAPAAAYQPASNSGQQPLPPVAEKAAPTPPATPATPGNGGIIAGAANGR